MLLQSKIYAVVPAKDIRRALVFYSDKLGLKPSREVPGGFIFECADGTSFNLYATNYAGTAQNTAMGWSVDDFDAAIAELTGKGVMFEKYDLPGADPQTGIVTMGESRAAWFKDSEDNILCVSKLTE